MRFDQAKYWARRGEGYRAEFAQHSHETNEVFRRQEGELAAILATYDFSGVHSVLEIGCGFGRLTSLLLGSLPNVETYTGVDVSRGQIAAAQEAFPRLDLQPTFVVGDFRRVALERADLVFAGEVFLHFPPNEIGAVLARASGLGRWLVHLDPYIPLPRMSASERIVWTARRARAAMPMRVTDWQHDYPRLYARKTVTIHPVLDGSQHLFVVH